MPKFFLAKTEPSEYSIDDLAKKGTDVWNGVRNPQAVIFLKQMEPGDKVIIYHSGEGKMAGLAEVVGNSRPDPNDTRSWLVDFKFLKKFEEPLVTLKQVKETGKFNDFRLVYQGRLSVMPVPENFIEWLKEQKVDL